MVDSRKQGGWNAGTRKVALGVGALVLIGMFAYGVIVLVGYLNGSSPMPIERMPREPVLGALNRTVSTRSANSPIVPADWITGTLMFNDGVIIGVAYPSEYFVLNPKRFGDEGPYEYHDFTHFSSYDTSRPQNGQVGAAANIRIATASHDNEAATVLSDYLVTNELEAEAVVEIDDGNVTDQRAIIKDNSVDTAVVSAVRLKERAGIKSRSFVVSLIYDETAWSAEDAQQITSIYDGFIRYLRIK